jgi:4-amino-4-deoxy-L-arabinose transferase-like glycosyltransferase
VLAYTSAQVLLAVRSNFYLAVNDSLGLVLMADRIDWSQPETLHNGFFPFALPAILAVLPADVALPVTGLLSALFGALALTAAYAIASSLGCRGWAVVAPVVLSLSPLFFAYFASPGPDLIATGLATAGVAVYVREAARSAPPRVGFIVAAGLLFGVAGLFRYHAALLGIGLLCWTVLQPSRRWGLTIAAALGLALGFLPQVVVNLLGGFGPFESDSAFTMYQSVVDINWHATSAIDPRAYGSALDVITNQPFEFTARYLESLQRFAVPILVVAAAALVLRPNRMRPAAFSLLIGTVGYAVVVSTGNSPRGLLPVLPLAAVAVAILAARAFDLTRALLPSWQRACAIAVIIGVTVTLPAVSEDVVAVDTKLGSERYRAATEAGVVATGLVDDARQILTNDFNLYLTDIAGTNPDKIGGWFNISLSGREPHRDVDLSSVTGFYCDAQKRGIRVVLWSPGSVPGLAPDLEAAFNGEWRTPLLRTGPPITGYTTTILVPGAYDCPEG